MKSILKNIIGKVNSLMVKNRLGMGAVLVLVLSASIGIGVYKSNTVATKNTQEKVSKEKVVATKVEKQDDKKIKEKREPVEEVQTENATVEGKVALETVYSPEEERIEAPEILEVEEPVQTQQTASVSSVDVSIVNRRGTTGNPAYHDGLPSASEVTAISLTSQVGNVTTFDYYFKDVLSIPSYGRQALGIQTGQLIVTINADNTATIQITGGVPVVTNTGSEAVGIANYTVGETRSVSVFPGQQVQGLLVQQSFGQSPLGSVDNLAGDYLLTFQ